MFNYSRGPLTAAKIEEDFDNFAFRGPGLYLTNTDTVLITPIQVNGDFGGSKIWNKEQPERTMYYVHVINDKYENTLLYWLAKAPTRVDDRTL